MDGAFWRLSRKGETDAVKLAELGHDLLRCTPEQLADALPGSPEPSHRKLLKLHLQRLKLLDRQIDQLSQMSARALKKHEQAVVRLAEVPGFGIESAQQMIAEVGVDAEAFPWAGEFASWGGACPGSNVSAEENPSSRCPKGNRYERRLLAEAAQAAVKKKGSHFQTVFRRFLPKLTYQGAIWGGGSPLGAVGLEDFLRRDQLHRTRSGHQPARQEAPRSETGAGLSETGV